MVKKKRNTFAMLFRGDDTNGFSTDWKIHSGIKKGTKFYPGIVW